MLATKMTRKAILRFDRLEERCVLVTWPLPPVQGPLPIMTTYGEWQEGGTFGIHFHEGIDIVPVNNGIAVYPVENGTIKGVMLDPVAYYSFMVVETNANVGWNYIHVVPGTDPNGVAWAPPMAVIGGGNPNPSQLGVVAAPPPGAAQHLHLDYGGAIDPYMDALQKAFPTVYPAAYGQIRRPIDDPLVKLPNLTDTIKPTVDSDIHFRVANHEFSFANRQGTLTWAGTNLPIGNNPQPTPLTGIAEQPRRDNHYFGTDVNFFYPWRWLGALAPTSALDGSPLGAGVDKSRIDIIGGAWDRIGTNNVADKVGVKQIGFSITGMGAQTGDILAFDFSGEFTHGGIIGNNPRPDAQDYGGLRDIKQVRVAYENDAFSDSTVGGTYWYTATNTSSVNATAVRIEEANGQRFWNSKVKVGNAWNDNDPTHVATINAQARFPDGFYRVNVWAKDAKGNKSDPVDKRVILDNFPQEIAPKGRPNGVGQMIWYGKQFLANSPVNIWHITSAVPEGVYKLSDYGTLLGTAMTDANGEFYDYDPGPGIYGGLFVADYDCDGYFVPQLDASVPILDDGSQSPVRLSVSITGTDLNPAAGGTGQQAAQTGADPVVHTPQHKAVALALQGEAIGSNRTAQPLPDIAAANRVRVVSVSEPAHGDVGDDVGPGLPGR